jgi:hypothetical protein
MADAKPAGITSPWSVRPPLEPVVTITVLAVDGAGSLVCVRSDGSIWRQNARLSPATGKYEDMWERIAQASDFVVPERAD